MARQIKGQGFNKEKLVFLCTSALLSGALYLYLAEKPILLKLPKPLSDHTAPGAHVERDTSVKFPVEYYVDGVYADKQSGRLLKVNRKRRTPFAPADIGFLVAERHNHPTENPVRPPKRHNPPPPPPPPPPPEDASPEPEPTRPTVARSFDLAVGFMGIVRLENGEQVAMLRVKDGNQPPRQVHVGDVLDEFHYKITKITPQAVWLTDEEGRPYILKDLEPEDQEEPDAAKAEPDNLFTDRRHEKSERPKQKTKQHKKREKQPSQPTTSDRKEKKDDRLLHGREVLEKIRELRRQYREERHGKK